MMHPKTLTFLLFLQAGLSFAQSTVQLELVAEGFDQLVDIAHAGDGRLFVVEKPGVIRIIDSSRQVVASPFLDIRARVGDNGSERGLLGLVFHPDYAENGYFYVNYTNVAGDTRISRFSVNASNPDAAEAGSEVILLAVDQPFANHNAGDLAFGPDGYLYIGLGDGGAAGDPVNAGQTRQTFLGKMLRIDVDQGEPYAIPDDNPFAMTDETLDEIWALGLRNPWRFSFDRLTGDLWIADVGQEAWEEINLQPADSPGGENYGWRCYEGDFPYNTADCAAASSFTYPVFSYSHNVGCSITGGFVYRGTDFPDLEGIYFYGDYCTGDIFGLQANSGGGWQSQKLADFQDFDLVTFGEDYRGELYAGGLSGRILQIKSANVTSLETAAPELHSLQAFFTADGTTLELSSDLPWAATTEVRIFNALGQMMTTRSVAGETRVFIATQNWPAGNYFVLLADSAQYRQVLQVSKQR